LAAAVTLAAAGVVLAAAAHREIGKKMNAQTFFTNEEQTRIEKAVADAEKTTAGEIVPIVVSASGSYAEVELLGMSLGLVLGTLAAFIFHDPWAYIHSQLLWPLGGAVIGFLLTRIPGIKRRLIARRRIADAVQSRSLAAFTAHGLHYTKGHTGILILVSLLEHRVIVLADRGINEKVPPGTWDEVVQMLTAGLKSGNACEAFCRAIERCGAILAQHFPRSADDVDELANKLVTE
jgi:putative membrane protein